MRTGNNTMGLTAAHRSPRKASRLANFPLQSARLVRGMLLYGMIADA